MTPLEAQKIANRYAKALLDAAIERNELPAVTAGMTELQRIFLEIPEMQTFFANPLISDADKQSLVQGQLRQESTPMVSNLLDLLLEAGRLEVLGEVLIAYSALTKKRDGIGEAEVTVPVALTDSLQNKLQETLQKMFGYQRVELTTKVDPAIIAGAIVKIGDKIIDGSYRGKIDTLRRQVG